jgi:hypothetical protein
MTFEFLNPTGRHRLLAPARRHQTRERSRLAWRFPGGNRRSSGVQPDGPQWRARVFGVACGSCGFLVRVAYRKKLANPAHTHPRLSRVLAPMLVVAHSVASHLQRVDAVLGDEMLLDRSWRVEEDRLPSGVVPEDVLGFLRRRVGSVW